MRTTTFKKVRVDLIMLAGLLLVGVLVSLPLYADAAAAVNCGNASPTRDADGDGISDAVECNATGVLTAGSPGARFPVCAAGTSSPSCLNPNSKDLFVIVVRAANSTVPTNPFEFVSNATTGGLTGTGLGLNIHEIANNNAIISGGTDDRLVFPASGSFPATYAVRVTENTADLSTGAILGQATNGTPATTGRIVVWPVRILQHVNEVRAAAGLAAVTATHASVVKYIKQVIAHEMGHVMGPMANVDATTASLYGGKHYAPTPGLIMSQYVTTDEILNLNNVTFPDDFTSGDLSALKLK
jgi:hypothetical protein